jgi:hypothetical protein
MPEIVMDRGTPASIKEITPPQTVAIEEDPLDSRMSETILIVYGKTSSLGMAGRIDFSAKAPCPISRLPGARRKETSPTENGGKL